MAEPRHRVKEVKKKTVVDRALNSALFLLAMIIIVGTDIILGIIWLSRLLSSKITGSAIFTDAIFVWFIGLAAGVTLLTLGGWFMQRTLKARRPSAPAGKA